MDNKENSNTVDPNTNAIDETAAVEATDDGITPDDKNVDDPKVEDAIEDSSEENAKNKDADGSEETKGLRVMITKQREHLIPETKNKQRE